ncbi:PhzF family phenazine biosynthesis protein [Microbacterium sp. CFBP9034]|uniref:PhzF family phenazine biosynthesis protein n=1 Tax=Microbacterium sp. CFBP9034 TaxID=3096540 RepID=UPI002A69BF37|nr:PhzF family phenazine biosynthesis protein [Microbacterium sp. CFBP9034]MDY0909915.1 PhzF family phenazine biosynthesis protein [Microbacterium sp. CFBP9034]
MTRPEVQRWAAFTDRPDGGNPAGVVIGADELDAPEMQRIAADVGYAETAFISGTGRRRGIRYFSPVAEVPFCGHATVASAVALAGDLGDGLLTFDTPVGAVEIVARSESGRRSAAFTSVEPWVDSLTDAALGAVLDLIGLDAADLDPAHPPRLAYAGNRHPLVVLADRVVFDTFTFDPSGARTLMDAEAWPATIIVLHALGHDRWEARNIFPVGAITEDPATGAAAAATGAYLRAIGAVGPPARIVIEQGRHVGRPGLLTVDIPAAGGITVSGGAVPID